MVISASSTIPEIDSNNTVLRYLNTKNTVNNGYSRLISECSVARTQIYKLADVGVFIESLQQTLCFLRKISALPAELRSILMILEDSIMKIKNIHLTISDFISTALDKIVELTNQPIANADTEQILKLISDNAFKTNLFSYTLSNTDSLHASGYQLKDNTEFKNEEKWNMWKEAYQQGHLLVETMEKASNSFTRAVSQIENTVNELRHQMNYFMLLHSKICQHFCAIAHCLESFETILSATGIHINQPPSLNEHSRQKKNTQPSSPIDSEKFSYECLAEVISVAFILPINIKTNLIANSIRKSYKMLKSATTEYSTCLIKLNQFLISTSAFPPVSYPTNDDLIKISSH